MLIFKLLLSVLLLAGPAGHSSDEPGHTGQEGFGSMDVLFFQYRLLMRDLLGRSCVYSPSCSHYGQGAIRERGPVLGVMVALERWTRCHVASLRSGEYADGPGPTVLDPAAGDSEVTNWGLSLLPF